MSGHSKWSTIKRKKEAADAKRGNIFTKLAKAISVAARDGADPESNFKLRMAIDKAKGVSMPKDNIQRAIDKGSGANGADTLQAVVYEAYGPGGIAILIESVTDNTNRTVSEIKHLLSKSGGSLGASGSVLWQFGLKGYIILKTNTLTDEQELELIDFGVEDIIKEEQIKLITSQEDLQTIKDKISQTDLEIDDAALEYIAKETIEPQDPDKIIKLLESLEEHDDVDSVYTNASL